MERSAIGVGRKIFCRGKYFVRSPEKFTQRLESNEEGTFTAS